MGRLQPKMDTSRFVSISFDSQRIKADGKSSCEVILKVSEAYRDKPVTLRLSAGSFVQGEKVRKITLTPAGDELRFRVFAPSFPKSAYLTSDGLRAPLLFSPAGFFQYLLFDLLPNLAIAVILALIVRSFAIASYYIPSGSMEPTLLIHDRLLADRFSFVFHLRQPKRGEVVIFGYPGNPRQDYIKRIIALPGERVKIEDGLVYVNGKPLKEPYVMEPPIYDMPEVIVPEGSYFVLGDNRNRSADSHIWGFVPEKNLKGRALLIYWPPNRIGLIRNYLSEDSAS